MIRFAALTSNMGMGPKPGGATGASCIGRVAGLAGGVACLLVAQPSASSSKAEQALLVCWSLDPDPPLPVPLPPAGAGNGDCEGDEEESDLLPMGGNASAVAPGAE